jgi:CRISPR-associated endonuclease/helicase Cas3
MSRSGKKANRLLQIEALLLAHPEGLTQADIARKLQVNRSTVGRYFVDLPGHIYLDDLDGNKWKVDREGYLVNVRFNLHEALAIHLATRLLATRMDRQNPHAAAALRKLGVSLERLAARISAHIKQSADVMDDAARRHDPLYMQVLEKLTRAWAEGRKVEVWHRHEPTGSVHKYKFAPYFVEPYAIGQTTHVIGWREPPGAMRTFKIERIERIELLAESYTIPADFNPRQFLTDAWGIWYTEEEPQKVVLRFSRSVANRVRESRWHESEQLVEEADGRLLWQAKVAEPQEMLPWIRGWGADVEVLGPERLREELRETAVHLNKLYQTVYTSKLPYQLPYAKTNPDNSNQIHLLLYHLVDVGQVALVMWQEVLTASIRQRLSDMLNLTISQAGGFVAFLAGLHDIGKAGPAYQQKYAPDWLRKELKDAGLGWMGIGKAYEPKTPHGTVSTWTLAELLPEMLALDRRFAYQIAVALGGHHGSWPPPGAADGIDDQSKYPLWDQVRRDLFWELQAVFHPPTAVTPPTNHTDLNTFLTIFSGLVSVADWLGSRNKECFGFMEQAMPTRQYADRAMQKAKESLGDLGWIGWQPDGRSLSFTEAFAYLKDIREPRGVQAEVIAAAQDAPTPVLLILEAPTGIGKTETAVYLADHWLQTHQGRGLYVAMPTQATSNQMYGRIGDFLNHHYADMAVNFHLVHGHAAWLDELKEKVELQSVGDDKDGKAGVQAESWFAPRKRTLLAPFGVGTVDQTLMSILQTHHFFVRLFGLSHKVIIFDEVHAYDTFMSTLFHRLLEWLSAVGTSVIILSATLPAKTRSELVQAYMGHELPDTPVSYPTLTIADSNTKPRTIELTPPENITLQLGWDVGREPEEILVYLQEKLVDGGCTAVICNTVRRAQDIYRVLDKARQDGLLDIEEDNLILFHARFPPIWRQAIEEQVLRKFGKPDEDGLSPYRPQKAIVVATQVIEQSLDLDFDLMITDLAPIDLLIQRAGRLHRHQRAERNGHERRLVTTQPPQDETGLPDFDSDVYVYEPYILLRSYLALHNRPVILLPGQTVELIEAVYGVPPADEELSLRLAGSAAQSCR